MKVICLVKCICGNCKKLDKGGKCQLYTKYSVQFFLLQSSVFLSFDQYTGLYMTGTSLIKELIINNIKRNFRIFQAKTYLAKRNSTPSWRFVSLSGYL